RWDGTLEDRRPRGRSVLRVVEGALHVVDGRRYVNRAAMLRAGCAVARGAVQRGEARQLAQRDVDLERRTGVVDGTDVREELGRERGGIHHPEEGMVRVGVGCYLASVELGAVGERHSVRGTSPGEDARHRS